EMLLFVELGRSLAPGPWLGSVLAVHALTGRLRDEVLAGRYRVAVVDDPNDSGGGLVADAQAADGLLVVGRDAVRYGRVDDRPFAPAASIDPTRRLARVRVHGIAPDRLDVGAAAPRRMAPVLLA